MYKSTIMNNYHLLINTSVYDMLHDKLFCYDMVCINKYKRVDEEQKIIEGQQK